MLFKIIIFLKKDIIILYIILFLEYLNIKIFIYIYKFIKIDDLSLKRIIKEQ